MTLAAVIVVMFCVVLGALIALVVALGLRRASVPDSGVLGQLAEVGRHLNGEAAVPEKFENLVARTSN